MFAHEQTGLSRLKLFLALSRTCHGLLDMATPGLAALLWLGTMPPTKVTLIGMLTAFAGYTAVYALNDLVDRRVDRQKLAMIDKRASKQDLDAVFVRHPLALGLLGTWEAFLWTAFWGLVALIGAYALNPVCATVFLLACLLEAAYCLLLKVSALRTLVSGVVKSSGAIAAVFAVDPSPRAWFLALLFLWLLLWEIGGQNVPNDWIDLEEDKHLHAKTVPVLLGPRGTCAIILGSLSMATMVSLGLFWATKAHLNPLYLVGAWLVGLYILMIPAYRLFKEKHAQYAATLFNRASYYPVAMLAVVVFGLIV
jgi:4-hydroxybenzoate polyprenyltransferase